jgi:hypothetical protein
MIQDLSDARGQELLDLYKDRHNQMQQQQSNIIQETSIDRHTQMQMHPPAVHARRVRCYRERAGLALAL